MVNDRKNNNIPEKKLLENVERNINHKILHKLQYDKAIAEIKAAPIYYKALKEYDEAKATMNLTETIIENSIVAQKYIETINKAFSGFDNRNREILRKRIFENYSLERLEELFYIDRRTIDNMLHKLAYLYLNEKGEDFRKSNEFKKGRKK